MSSTNPSPLLPVVRKLEVIFDLSAEERHAILDLPAMVQEIRADQDIVREGDRPSRCCALLDGIITRYKITGAGKRQILSFHIAGEIPDLQSLHLRTMDHTMAALTGCQVAFIDHEDLRGLCSAYPRIASVLWRETLIDAAIFREWMVGMGRRPANVRIAHLFCELVARLQAVSLATFERANLPITQEEFGDALGISTVHVNRVLQELRSAGLITLQNGILTIPNWADLEQFAEFDVVYLHQVGYAHAA